MFAWLRKLVVGNSAADAQPEAVPQDLGASASRPEAANPFLVQRANVGGDPNWRTLCATVSEEYAREVYNKQLTLSSTGRFRLLNPAGQLLAEAKSQPLFERKVFEGYGPSAYYVPERPAPRKH